MQVVTTGWGAGGETGELLRNKRIDRAEISERREEEMRMSGLEDLRKLIAGMYTFVKLEHIVMSSYLIEHPGDASKRLKDVLTDMVDSVELKEDAVAATDWEAVRDVSNEMKRYVFGRPEIDDLVYAWASSLDVALDGREERELTPGDAEAMAWVREHGGIEHVRAQWGHLMGRAGHADRADRALARRQRQIDESHAALRRRNERIRSLASELNRAYTENREKFMRHAGDYTGFADEACRRLVPERRHMEGCSKDVMDAALSALDRRLMPPGYEWPRRGDGSLVELSDGRGEDVVDAVAFCHHTAVIDFKSPYVVINPMLVETTRTVFLNMGERVAPRVRDAEGKELRVGDGPVWYVYDVTRTPLRVTSVDGSGTVTARGDGVTAEVRSSLLTRVKPSDSWKELWDDMVMIDGEAELSYEAFARRARDIARGEAS